MSKTKLGIGGLFLLLTASAVVFYFAVLYYGLQLIAPEREIAFVRSTGIQANILGLVMIALAVITFSSRLLGVIGEQWFAQPLVIGEILTGILLGPSLLGAVAPAVSHLVFPSQVLPAIGIVANIGVVLFMFVIGLEIDAMALRRSSRPTIIVSHASIILPFLLGTLLSLYLYPRYGRGDVSFTAFSLFFGVSLSLTAFPVLARILKEQQVQRTPLGLTALACAALNDVTAWALLALVVGIVTADVRGAMTTVPSLIAYLAVMFVIVRPAFQWLSRRVEQADAPPSMLILTTVIVGLLLSAATTEMIGIHALFGAFLFGVFLPHDGKLTHALRERIEDLVAILFLPAFFAFTGLRTQIGLLSGIGDWAVCGLIILVATIGKFGGSYCAARYAGLGRRESSALGVLMNTRGLVELIVLNVGLDLGILSPKMFAMMVIMALVTTLMTSPIFSILKRGLNLNAAFDATPRPKAGQLASM